MPTTRSGSRRRPSRGSSASWSTTSRRRSRAPLFRSTGRRSLGPDVPAAQPRQGSRQPRQAVVERVVLLVLDVLGVDPIAQPHAHVVEVTAQGSPETGHRLLIHVHGALVVVAGIRGPRTPA